MSAADALLSEHYRNGRAAGLQGLQPSGRPDGTRETEEWLNGYRSGIAERLVIVQRAEVKAKGLA